MRGARRRQLLAVPVTLDMTVGSPQLAFFLTRTTNARTEARAVAGQNGKVSISRH